MVSTRKKKNNNRQEECLRFGKQKMIRFGPRPAEILTTGVDALDGVPALLGKDIRQLRSSRGGCLGMGNKEVARRRLELLLDGDEVGRERSRRVLKAHTRDANKPEDSKPCNR
jgi:hypothetical protein